MGVFNLPFSGKKGRLDAFLAAAVLLSTFDSNELLCQSGIVLGSVVCHLSTLRTAVSPY